MRIFYISILIISNVLQAHTSQSSLLVKKLANTVVLIKLHADKHTTKPDATAVENFADINTDVTIIEAVPYDYFNFSLAIDQMISSILSKEKLLAYYAERAPLSTFFLTKLGKKLCNQSNNSLESSFKTAASLCVDYRLAVLLVHELIEALTLLKKHHLEPSGFLLDSVLVYLLRYASVYSSNLLVHARKTTLAVIEKTKNRETKKRLYSFLREIAQHRKTSKNISSYTRFMRWFSSSFTRLMMLDVFVLESILITESLLSSCFGCPEEYTIALYVGASHAEHLKAVLLGEGYTLKAEQYY